MDKILTKIFYIVFQFSKLLLIKVCKIQSLDLLFLVVFISFYISRYHFLPVFRTSFNIIWKKDFRYKFFFLSGFTQTPPPPPPPHPRNNSQNPLSVIKDFFNAPWIIAVFQDCYSMMMLGRTRTVEQNWHFNPTSVSGLLSSYKSLDWGQPKTFIYGRKTFIYRSHSIPYRHL